ncbi:MAG: hypothetical protein B6I38_04075 [Anaerolineaceae bacterium 4572_5.1]|nr:MAG: hypothetical protein B5M51_02900 [Anaerolinea sp. 4484_236]OQY32891.1 MAG: hypothetical protein B6I38_04075 [Anaerolineaceae bacterium 4572_5.1]
MKHTASIGGIKTELILPSVLYLIPATILTVLYPEIFIIRIIPRFGLLLLGGIFLLIGIPFLIRAAYEVVTQFESGELITDGLFAFVRNPIYAAWILFIIPGLALLSRSWIFLGTPIITYLAFKISIRKEEEYLEKHFGQPYLDYKAKTNALLPRFRKKT